MTLLLVQPALTAVTIALTVWALLDMRRIRQRAEMAATTARNARRRAEAAADRIHPQRTW